MEIQWYPGHMARTRREIEESLKMADLIAEIVDARIPVSSRNPDLARLAGGKPWLIVLNRSDQADPAATSAWASFFEKRGINTIETDSKTGTGCTRFTPKVREILADKLRGYEEKGQPGRSLKIMILGIPNVGKSSFINRISGRASLRAEDRPGVTRSKQWVRLSTGIDMMDTPGMLWPKLGDQTTGLHLAFTGAIRDDILDIDTLSARLMENLAKTAADALAKRYKIDENALKEQDGFALIKIAAAKRGMLLSGGIPDTERMSKTLLDEFRSGKLGRITLERPPAEPSGENRGDSC